MLAELAVGLLLASMVNIRPALIQMGSNQGVRAACNGVVETACTRFDGATMSCGCALHGDRWSPVVRIDAQPRMYVSHSMYLLHELSHIFDFKRAMLAYAATIEAEKFTSSDACAVFADEIRLSFGAVLLDYHDGSMLRRDHVLADRK